MLPHFPDCFNTCITFCNEKLLFNLRRPIQNPIGAITSNNPVRAAIFRTKWHLLNKFLVLLTYIGRLLSCCFWLRCKKAGFDLQCHDGNYVNKIPNNAKRNGEIGFMPKDDVSWNERKKMTQDSKYLEGHRNGRWMSKPFPVSRLLIAIMEFQVKEKVKLILVTGRWGSHIF
jgi:hypothetical protein